MFHHQPDTRTQSVAQSDQPKGGERWIDRVWILVPMLQAGFVGFDETGACGERDSLVHSGSDRVLRLRQASSVPEDCPDLGCTDVELISVGNVGFLSAVVHLAPEPAEGVHGSITQRRHDLETYCSDVAGQLVDRYAGGYGVVQWVNRTLIVDKFDADNRVWLSPDNRSVSTLGIAGEEAQMLVSWGNNLLRTSAFDDPIVRHQVQVGMIDAQCVWLDLEAIGEAAERLVHQQVVQPGGVVLGSGHTESLLVSVARHNLLYDEVLIHASSARSAVAKGFLNSWGYSQMRDRIDARVRDSDAIDQRRRLKRAAEHEGRVAKVLLMLSMLSGAQLILSVVGLAYSGDVAAHPGVSRSSVFFWVRVVGTDIWLLLTILLAMLGYWRLQAGGDKDG